MTKVNVHEAKPYFSSLLSQVEEKGEPVLICGNGKPVANRVPHRPFKRNVKPHPRLSKMKINCDPAEPLTPEEWGRVEV